MGATIGVLTVTDASDAALTGENTELPTTAVDQIVMRPRNALGYRRYPFRQQGDIDPARRARFPSLPQQL